LKSIAAPQNNTIEFVQSGGTRISVSVAAIIALEENANKDFTNVLLSSGNDITVKGSYDSVLTTWKEAIND